MMKDIFERMLEAGPYDLDSEDKRELLDKRLISLSERHYAACEPYRRIVNMMGIDLNRVSRREELPFLPVRLFKELELRSVPDDEIVKTMTSSGTTGQKVSKIYLDRATAGNQQKAFVKIVSSFTGSARMPMLVIDSPGVIKNRAMFSARGAGILGFSVLGRDRLYALDEEMHLDFEAVEEFLNRHRDEKILLFGFTFMVWQYFIQELIRLRGEGRVLDLSRGILIHGGGWKKISGVSRSAFHKSVEDACGLKDIHDYYGMVEQTGCVYMQCECGHLHASVFSDVLIRDPCDFSVCEPGKEGLIQVLSAIPESYPGHSLLTEDIGVLLGEDDCPCGRKGKYFSVNGRIQSAEIRGCSDTYEVGR